MVDIKCAKASSLSFSLSLSHATPDIIPAPCLTNFRSDSWFMQHLNVSAFVIIHPGLLYVQVTYSLFDCGLKPRRHDMRRQTTVAILTLSLRRNLGLADEIKR